MARSQLLVRLDLVKSSWASPRLNPKRQKSADSENDGSAPNENDDENEEQRELFWEFRTIDTCH